MGRSVRIVRGDRVARRRWLVHLTLIVGFLAAVISALFVSRRYLGHSGTTDHSLVGLVVLAVVIGHLLQRRRTISQLFSRLVRRRTSRTSRTGHGASDVVLGILTLSTMVSGAADFVVGHTIYLPVPGPFILHKWHAMSVLVLVVYVTVHVVRRRGRLRTSHVR